jgi:hypothetical protein
MPTLPVQGVFSADSRRQGVSVRATSGASVVSPDGGTVVKVLTSADASPPADLYLGLPAAVLAKHVPGVLVLVGAKVTRGLLVAGRTLHYIGSLNAVKVAAGAKVREGQEVGTAGGAPVWWGVWRYDGDRWFAIDPSAYLYGRDDQADARDAPGPYGTIVNEWAPETFTRGDAVARYVWLLQEAQRAKLPASERGALLLGLRMALDDLTYNSTDLDLPLAADEVTLAGELMRGEVIDLLNAAAKAGKVKPPTSYKPPADAAERGRKLLQGTPPGKPRPKAPPARDEPLPFPPYDIGPIDASDERNAPKPTPTGRRGFPWWLLGTGTLLLLFARRRKRRR